MERVAWRRRGMTRAVRPRVTANCDGSATFFDSTRVGDDIGGQDQKMGKQYEEEGEERRVRLRGGARGWDGPQRRKRRLRLLGSSCAVEEPVGHRKEESGGRRGGQPCMLCQRGN